MRNVPENELFSAYLDGELTAGEQAQVEELLTTSPSARQLLDELRALSTGLQSLPTQRLEEDLSGRVLRQAERRILGEGLDRRVRPASIDSVGTERPALLKRLFRPRTFLWSGLAVAVAVMLMGREPEPPAPDGVAVAPPEAQAPEIGPLIEPSPEPATPPAPAAAMMAADAPPETPPTPAPAMMAADAPPAPAAAMMAADAPPETPPTPAPALMAADAPPAPAAAMMAADAPPETPPAPAPAMMAADAPPAPAAAMMAADAPPASPPKPEGPEAPEILLVRCEVSREVIEKNRLEEILAARKIVALDAAPPEDVESDGEAVTVQVEATTQQIRVLLADLRSNADEFRKLKTIPNRTAIAPQVQSIKIGAPNSIRIGPSRSAGGGGVGLDAAVGADGSASPRKFGSPGVRMKIGAQNGTQKPAGGGKGPTGAKAAPPKEATGADVPKVRPKAAPKFRVRFVLKVVEPPPAEADSATDAP